MTPPPGELSTVRDTTYIFNVCVYPLSGGTTTGICKKARPTLPELEKLHGKQVKKLYVEVI